MYSSIRKSRKRVKANNFKEQNDFLAKLNHLSQIGLFILAVFGFGLGLLGYFYTVKPLYSKALLEEQIAEKK